MRKEQILKKLEELEKRFIYENNLMVGPNQRFISILIRRINLYKNKLYWINFDEVGIKNAIHDMKDSETYEEKQLTVICLCSSLRTKVKLIRVLKKSIEVQKINFSSKLYKEKYYNSKYDSAIFYNYDKSEIIHFDK